MPLSAGCRLSFKVFFKDRRVANFMQGGFCFHTGDEEPSPGARRRRSHPAVAASLYASTEIAGGAARSSR
jgi:hypothetical protein